MLPGFLISQFRSSKFEGSWKKEEAIDILSRWGKTFGAHEVYALLAWKQSLTDCPGVQRNWNVVRTVVLR